MSHRTVWIAVVFACFVFVAPLAVRGQEEAAQPVEGVSATDVGPRDSADATHESTASASIVPPYNALLRSAIVPGWGQMAIHQPVQGLFFAVSTAGLLTSWWIVRSSFQRMYNDEYLPLYESDPGSEEEKALYRTVNQRFKVSRALLFTGLGIWAYSLIDAYVDANIYNAEIRAEGLLLEGERMRRLGVEWEGGSPLLRLRMAF